MSILKCTKCNKESKHTGFIKASGYSGLTGSMKGIFKVLSIWPFQTKIKTFCENCKEETLNIVKK